jgi:phage FluMu protein Com
VTEIRCKKCNRLLMKIKKKFFGTVATFTKNEGGKTDHYPYECFIETRCGKCGYINEINDEVLYI